MASTSIEPVEALLEFRVELVPKDIVEFWAKSPEEYLSWSEPKLRTELRAQCGPLQKDFSLLTKIRLAFWEEYERAARLSETMDTRRLYKGACRNAIYFDTYRKYPALAAWVICPLAGYLLQRKELEFLAEERMVEVLSVSAVKEDGKVDSRLAKVQVELYQALQDRIYGSVTQKIQSEQKSVNVNVQTSQTAEEASKTIGMITNIDELDNRIKTIQEKRKALQTIPQPIEINAQKLMRPDQPENS